MDNSAVPLVTIKLDKERHLKLTLGGMKKFAEVTGKSLLKGFNIGEMDESQLIAFIWACLVWEDKNLTVEDCGYMLDFSQLTEISTKLAEAINAASPKTTTGNPQNPPIG